MERKEFCKKAGCGILGFSAIPLLANDASAQGQEQSPKRKQFKIDIEIYEARQDTWCHKKGDKFDYPKDMATICPWLLSSMHDFIRLLQNDVTLTWKYEGTPYEKIINKDGITTEYVRCPDPTANLVAKITRTEIQV
ncbi:MAG: TIGR04076 family protein [Bacteroidales bacterium]|nr:TIGR04076 family protein [Bacteroidales bacterium]